MSAVWSDFTERRSDPDIQGFSLIGLLCTLTVLGVAGVLFVRAGPSIFEYWAIEKAVRAASAMSGTPAEVRVAYERLASVGYIDAVQAKDLKIEGSGDAMTVSFAYEKRIPLAGPASLVISYQGSTAGDAAVKTAN